MMSNWATDQSLATAVQVFVDKLSSLPQKIKTSTQSSSFQAAFQKLPLTRAGLAL